MSEVEIPEKKTRSISYSQYSMWATCPLQWKKRSIDKEETDSGINLVFGTAMHDTIQTWLKLLYSNDPKKANLFDMHEFLKERLMVLSKKELIKENRHLTSKEELIEFYVDGCNILDHVRKYTRDFFPKNFELKGIELPLEIVIRPNVRFKAFIDVVLYHKQTKTIYIYDFKTSRAGWYDFHKKDVKKTDQLLLYKKFYSDQFGVPVDNIHVTFVILKRKISQNSEYVIKHISKFEPSQGTVSLNRTMKRFEEFVSIFDEDGSVDTSKIKATPSESACKYCPFRNDPKQCSHSFFLASKRNIKNKNV